MSEIINGLIIAIEELKENIFKMEIKSAAVVNTAKAGQFVNVKCGEGINALLRRPISICRINPDKGTFDIVFQIKGTGTEMLSKMKPGERVNFLGPLGKPFDLSDKHKNIAVIGGGIGVFPMLMLLSSSKASIKNAYLGFRNVDNVVFEDEFSKLSNRLAICTDDGSYGMKGLVTSALEQDLRANKPDIIYTCGPGPMMKNVSRLASEYSIPCQVSLEQRMGCGIGACLVCACKTGSEENWKYSHICKDGPVFWSNEVLFDE